MIVRQGPPFLAVFQSLGRGCQNLLTVLGRVLLLGRVLQYRAGLSDQRAALRRFTGELIGRYINVVTLVEGGSRICAVVDPNFRAEVMMLKELIWNLRYLPSTLVWPWIYHQTRLIS